ncbi:MAG TPA: hypothetical protein PLY80_20610 [Pseudomonadota bacterium]|jgi:hypothetical protein|nr:hypothetical protein [Pseudomonadota bacterium]HNI61221.1 hypothetical protein [Pseudomonadota bacterium]
MNRLLWLLGVIALLYFAVTVPIGKHTLWGHMVRIAKTPEAKELADGAKETARDVARKAQKELDSQAETNRPATRQPQAE